LNITQINNNPTYKQPSFKNAQFVSNMFMAIDKHVILGVSAIDLGSMVIPRSAIDFTRNKQAGIETAFRESSSTATHAAIGVAGLGAAALLALGLKNKNYGVDFKKITANEDTIENMAQLFKSIVDTNPTSSTDELAGKFLHKVFEDVKGLSGNSDVAGSTIWSSLKQNSQTLADGTAINTKNEIVNLLLKAQKENKSFRIPGKVLDRLQVYLNMDIPSTQSLKVQLANKTVNTEGIHLLEDAYSLTKSFTSEKVLKSFKEAKDAASVEFVKDLKKLSLRKTILGLSAICAVALSMQSFNRHMTKKRTGHDGFVGDPDYEKNTKVNAQQQKTTKKDNLFVPLKMLSMLCMGFFIYKTITANKPQNTPILKDLASKLQFKGSLPTMNQIKLVYGSTILGRLFAANDTNELRESSFRDFLGYTNFLLLGSLITKCFVNMKDKSLINYENSKAGKGIKKLFEWMKNSSIKTHQEVVNSYLKHNVLADDTKNGIKPLRELYDKGWIKQDGEIAKKLSTLNKAKVIGILYSCVALGIVIPLINKYMTERKHKKQSNSFADKPVKTQDNNPENSNIKTQQIISDFLKKPDSELQKQ